MSVFQFCVGHEPLLAAERARARKVAAKHGVDFIYISDAAPNWTAARYWFEAANYGDAHDRPLAAAVRADLVAARIG